MFSEVVPGGCDLGGTGFSEVTTGVFFREASFSEVRASRPLTVLGGVLEPGVDGLNGLGGQVSVVRVGRVDPAAGGVLAGQGDGAVGCAAKPALTGSPVRAYFLYVPVPFRK
ncbi:hypothetical protein Ssi03_04180 [Sphaerisporangium siamense]|nr:hypothetical protein Ssi03_04180 [Sphaerisporangium siamense]